MTFPVWAAPSEWFGFGRGVQNCVCGRSFTEWAAMLSTLLVRTCKMNSDFDCHESERHLRIANCRRSSRLKHLGDRITIHVGPERSDTTSFAASGNRVLLVKTDFA